MLRDLYEAVACTDHSARGPKPAGNKEGGRSEVSWWEESSQLVGSWVSAFQLSLLFYYPCEHRGAGCGSLQGSSGCGVWRGGWRWAVGGGCGEEAGGGQPVRGVERRLEAWWWSWG